jgi:hypothetical protein
LTNNCQCCGGPDLPEAPVELRPVGRWQYLLHAECINEWLSLWPFKVQTKEQ